MKEIREFIRIICDDLKISVPNVRFTKSFKGSDTLLAEYDSHSNILMLRSKYENILDMFFCIAHELRHKYQLDKDIYDFSSYVTSSTVDIKTYNMQEIELDANAYAYVVMVSAFNVEPLFNGMDEEVKRHILRRAFIIAEDSK